jgi:hypothetical protein
MQPETLQLSGVNLTTVRQKAMVITLMIAPLLLPCAIHLRGLQSLKFGDVLINYPIAL